MEEIKKLLGTKNLIIGKEETMKAIRSGELKKVFLASNADPSLKEDIEYYNKIKEFEVVLLKINNEDLGVMCKKPFSIQVLGVK
ncbi:MAG: ribosomal L7Ae/L30e/S12e/Gadd45 family protein [Candidatus Woesearchaeota archaeon]